MSKKFTVYHTRIDHQLFISKKIHSLLHAHRPSAVDNRLVYDISESCV